MIQLRWLAMNELNLVTAPRFPPDATRDAMLDPTLDAMLDATRGATPDSPDAAFHGVISVRLAGMAREATVRLSRTRQLALERENRDLLRLAQNLFNEGRQIAAPAGRCLRGQATLRLNESHF